jgi:hypothetical protein
LSVWFGEGSKIMRIRGFALACLLLVVAPSAGSALLSPAGAATRGGGGGKADRTAPVVSIATPGSGTSVAGAVTVSGSSSDNAAVSSVSVSVDGGPWSTASGTGSWSWSWSTSSWPNGTHTVAARAVDTSGNASTTSVSVTVSNPTADTTAPTVAFGTPAAGATVSGTVTVNGTASDNASVTKVEVKVDSGVWQTTSGTLAWSWAWSTSAAAAGTHTLTARATDSSGNTSTTTRSVSVAGTSSDTTPPAVSISTPSSGATLTGTVSVQGTVSDNVGVSRLEAAVDGKPWQQVYVKASWAWPWVTGHLSNGTHTLHVRATDTSGNVSSVALPVTVSNPCSDGNPVLSQGVTAEGVVIRICTTAGGWTTSAIESLLRQNARDLATVGEYLVIEVQTTYQTGESTGIGSDGYTATLYLNPGASTSFTTAPDALMAHEYGHAWTTYWENMNPANNGTWDHYLAARGLSGDSRVDSSYNWSAVEMAADDYRRLFGSATAQSELKFINSEVPDSQAVAGLADFFLNQWAVP